MSSHQFSDDTGSYHHYESVRNGPNESHYESDSFDSDSDYDSKPNMVAEDSGVDMGNIQLPEPPNNQPYVNKLKRLLTRRKTRKTFVLLSLELLPFLKYAKVFAAP